MGSLVYIKLGLAVTVIWGNEFSNSTYLSTFFKKL